MKFLMTPGPKQPAKAGEHLQELDGLRAIAIATVFAFHMRLPGFSLGWAGVQLFFVISGFLITRILLKSRQRPRYFRNFYIRRTLRIFPIYYLLLVAYFAVAWIEGDTHTVGLMPYYLTYTQTYPQIASNFTDARLLVHTWTLAIEEQFYLMWPLAIFLLRGRWLVGALAGCFGLALATRLWAQEQVNTFLSVAWLPTQLDLLAAGAVIAVLSATLDAAALRRWGYVLATVGSVAACAIVVHGGLDAYWSPMTWVHLPTSPYLPTAMAVAFAGVVALTATQARPTRWLANRAMMRVGKISYGLYLFHPFVFRLADHLGGPLVQAVHSASLHRLAAIGLMIAKFAAVLLAAECSWRFYEGPINALKDRLTGKGKAKAGQGST